MSSFPPVPGLSVNFKIYFIAVFIATVIVCKCRDDGCKACGAIGQDAINIVEDCQVEVRGNNLYFGVSFYRTVGVVARICCSNKTR